MISINSLGSLLIKGGELLQKVLNNKFATKADKIIAISSIQKAVNATRIFLEDNLADHAKYKPNEKLSNQWLDAFTAIHKFDTQLAEQLRHKSNFWASPQKWLAEPSSLEMVPKLKDLDNYAEGLLQQIN